MDFIVFVCWILAAVWGILWAARGSVVLGSALYLMLSSVFGPEFYSFEFAGMTMSADRLVMPAVFAAFFVQRFVFRRQVERSLTQVDVVLLGFVGLLLTNTFLHDWQRDVVGQVPILPHLVEGYLLPIVLYSMIKRSVITEKDVNRLLVLFALFGLYLAFTAICEVTGNWAWVVPRYIADPDLGIHFGRARGPFLQSVRLGVYLMVGLGSIWITLVYRASWGRAGRVLGLALAAFIVAAIVTTLTRSVWLGLLVAAFLLVQLTFVGIWRRGMITAMAGGLAVALVLSSQSIVSLEREDGSQATAQSTSMRAVFTYVSWTMFKDSPITGCGFGHFPHLKDGYLNDRSTALQLETVRGFIHHNTYFSLLVELGIFGLILIVVLIVALMREGRQLWSDRQAAPWMREVALLFLLFCSAFSVQMMFHEVSYSPVEFGLFFVLAGAMSASLAQRQQESTSRQYDGLQTVSYASSVVPVAEVGTLVAPQRVHLFGVEIDAMTMAGAMTRVFEWIAEDDPPCRFVVTPNVDHTVMLHERKDLRQVYQDADLVLADGWPVVAASRLVRKPLPSRVAGSDLVPSLFAGHRNGQLTVFLLGAMPGVADRAADEIQRQWPQVQVVGTYSPPRGFEDQEQENKHILQLIERARPDLLVVGLGAPKQELWVHQHRRQIKAKVALCVGATIDFLAGEKARAPRWLQAIGLEWFHRLIGEPQRLVRRYAHDAWVFPQLVWREWYQTAKRA